MDGRWSRGSRTHGSDSRVDLTQISLESLPPISVSVGVLFLVLAVGDLLVLPRATAITMSLARAGAALVLFAVALAVRRSAIPPRWAHATGAGVAGLLVANNLLRLALTAEFERTTYFFLLVIVAVGSFLLSTPWFALVMAGTLAGWGAMVWTDRASFISPPSAGIQFGLVVFGAILLSALIHRQRVRTLRQLKEAQEELRQYAEDLEERNEELDAFAHTVAHDLKNPLQHLIGYAEVLRGNYDGLPDETRASALQTIVRAADRMDDIIGELLLLAAVRRGEVRTEPLHMAPIVAAAQDRLAYVIEERNARISVPETWPAAMGHAAWVEEAWANYLSNAIKYGGDPPRVELGASEQPDGMVRFWVRDNGQGLTPEEQARLFVPFTRLHQVKAEGQGLGLSIVRRIIDKLGGQVGIESEVGEGSTFFFTLPLA